MTTQQVAHSYRADTQTRELGQDWKQIKVVDEALQKLMRELAILETSGDSSESKKIAHDMCLSFFDARNDASWGGFVLRAKEAFVEADVRSVRVAEAAE